MQESENCSHNCRECGSDCAERREPQSFLEEPKAGTHVKRVIGIVSGKGGVGKSLVTSLLASAMQKRDAYWVSLPFCEKNEGIDTERTWEAG